MFWYTWYTRLHAHGLLWNLLSVGVTQGSTLAGSILAARSLDVRHYGAFGILFATMVTAASISQLSMGLTATRFVAEYRAADSGRALRIVVLVHAISIVSGLTMALGLIASSGWLASQVFHAPQLVVPLRLGAVYVALATLSGAQMGALAGAGDYRALARASVISGCLHCILIWIGAKFGGVIGAVCGVTVALGLRVLLLHVLAPWLAQWRAAPMRFAEVLAESRMLTSYAIPAALSGFSTMPSIWLTNSMLVRSVDGLGQMGLLTAALTMRTLVLFFPGVVDTVATTRLGGRLGARDRSGFWRAFSTNLAVSVSAAAVVAAVIWLFRADFLRLFGTAFVGNDLVIGMLLVSAVAQAISTSVYQLVSMTGWMWASFWLIALPRDISLVVASSLLIPGRGAAGVALGYAVAWSLGLMTTGAVAWLGASARLRNLWSERSNELSTPD